MITASTGNHGQSIAFASRIFGVRAIVCVPEQANPVKVASMRGLGAELVFHGDDFDDAREHCESLAAEHGHRYIHSGNEPHLIAGVGTHTLETLERQPDLDVLIVPIGGGSGAAGACIVAAELSPDTRVIGVQSEAAPAAYRSWKEGVIAEDRMGTAAEGLATRVGFELPQQILRERLSRFRPRLGGRPARGDPAHARADPEPDRACGRRAARRGVAARPRREEGRPDRQRREHDVRPAPRAAP